MNPHSSPRPQPWPVDWGWRTVSSSPAGWTGHKPTLYALSLGYLFPSQYEGFGMMLLEAMQAGTPVVTSL